MSQAVAEDRIGNGRVVARAHSLAEREHAGQSRKGNGEPYLEHVVSVAEVLHRTGFDEEVVAAAVLHDAVEHTDVGPGLVEREFGERVGGLVGAMTDREDIEPWQKRKDEHRSRVEAAGRDACAIYGADKLAGIREAREGYAEVGERVEERLGNTLDQRISVWRADIALLEGLEPPLPFAGDVRTELEGLLDDRENRTLPGR